MIFNTNLMKGHYQEMKSPNKDIVAQWILELKNELGDEEFEKMMQRASEQLSKEDGNPNQDI